MSERRLILVENQVEDILNLLIDHFRAHGDHDVVLKLQKIKEGQW